MCGLGSSVGIATDYGLDGPGSNKAITEAVSRNNLTSTCRPVITLKDFYEP